MFSKGFFLPIFRCISQEKFLSVGSLKPKQILKLPSKIHKTRVGKDVKKLEPFPTVSKNIKWADLYGKQ